MFCISSTSQLLYARLYEETRDKCYLDMNLNPIKGNILVAHLIGVIFKRVDSPKYNII